MSQRALVLDANILIRAVLGDRVRNLISEYANRVHFFAPDTAYAEAREHLPVLLEKRGVDGDAALAVLDALESVVRVVDAEVYGERKRDALARIADRDPDDWQALACALVLGCAVWTEDADFFGTGVATWITSRVRLCLAAHEP